MVEKWKRNENGFTLVEILVVLVILSILAAVSVPSMVGFIDDAKGKANIAEARTVYVAAQAAIADQIASAGGAIEGLAEGSFSGDDTVAGGGEDLPGKVAGLVTGSLAEKYSYTVTLDATGTKVDTVEYTANGYAVTIHDGNTTVTQKEE